MTNGAEKSVHTLVPAVDIVETKGSYIVKLDIPGAVKDKIKAQIDDNTLHVSALIADYIEIGKESEPVREYRREFSLANDVDVNTIDAQVASPNFGTIRRGSVAWLSAMMRPANASEAPTTASDQPKRYMV